MQQSKLDDSVDKNEISTIPERKLPDVFKGLIYSSGSLFISVIEHVVTATETLRICMHLLVV